MRRRGGFPRSLSAPLEYRSLPVSVLVPHPSPAPSTFVLECESCFFPRAVSFILGGGSHVALCARFCPFFFVYQKIPFVFLAILFGRAPEGVVFFVLFFDYVADYYFSSIVFFFLCNVSCVLGKPLFFVFRLP